MATRRLRNKKRPAAARWLRRSANGNGPPGAGATAFKAAMREIVRIVTEANADMLVNGCSPSHTGIKDYIYGETVDQVRHKLTIPVLIAPPKQEYICITKVYANNPVYTIAFDRKEDNECIAFIIRSVLAEFKITGLAPWLWSNHGWSFTLFQARDQPILL